jgi:3-deoxy-D-manno-octulosonate 8-phosphate phosphatase (KDO 8-P phosphatase)
LIDNKQSELFMVHLPNSIKEKARDIKLVVFDVDGVLTDGTLSYSANGEEVKHFNVKDGVGIKLLNAYEITTAVISAKDSAPLRKRIADLDVLHFYPACKDKWERLSELMDELWIAPNEVCYVGDDVIDLKVMKRIGLSITPADGFWLVKEHSDLITDALGGKGVAREVADIILASRMPLEEAYIKAMLPEFEKTQDV